MATATNINGWNVGGNNNSFDQRGHFYRAVLSGNVSGMLVKQNSTPNMTVLVEHGSALLNKNTTSASVAEIKSDTSVTIDTANTSNPRIDTVVIYEDTSVAIPTVEASYWQDGAGGRFKIVSLPGTAAAVPTALTDTNIQSAIGAGKPWTRLADITVPANSTTILNSNIADKRVQMGGTIPNKSVTADKLDFTTLATTLYTGPSALTGSISLSQPATSFRSVEIGFDKPNTVASTIVIRDITIGTLYSLTMTRKSGSVLTTYSCTISLGAGGNTINLVEGGAVALNSTGVAGFGTSNEIRILKVTGCK